MVLPARARKHDARFDEHFLKKLEYLYIVSKKIFAGGMRAERRTKKVGSGIEFADHRNYTLGDDFRYIDWNIYGRMERLLLRLFEEEEDLSIYLLVDCSRSMGFDMNKSDATVLRGPARKKGGAIVTVTPPPVYSTRYVPRCSSMPSVLSVVASSSRSPTV